MTATFGGVIRDTLCRRPARILHSNAEIYASTALFGATSYVCARSLGFSPALRVLSGVAACSGLREAAVNYDMKLPVAPWLDKKD